MIFLKYRFMMSEWGVRSENSDAYERMFILSLWQVLFLGSQRVSACVSCSWKFGVGFREVCTTKTTKPFVVFVVFVVVQVIFH